MIAYSHKENTYTPNPFVRIGLFALTFVLSILAFGLLCLMFYLGHSGGSIYVLCTIWAVLIYIALEWTVSKNGHFHSGIDDALLWVTVLFAAVGLTQAGDGMYNGWICLICGLLFLWGVVRFADRVMAVGCLLAFLGALCLSVSPLIAPLLMAAFSLSVYLAANGLQDDPRIGSYAPILQVLTYVSLLTLYGSLNDFAVREGGASLLHIELSAGLPFGWLFWTFTGFLPVLFLSLGILGRNRALIDCGLATLAATIVTIRYYYHLLPTEVAMTAGGVLLIGISYGLIRFLREPRGGFTSEELNPSSGSAVVESLVIAQAFGPKTALPPDQGGTTLGGGSFGGGGAGGTF
jgi:hypothetical protein